MGLPFWLIYFNKIIIINVKRMNFWIDMKRRNVGKRRGCQEGVRMKRWRFCVRSGGNRWRDEEEAGDKNRREMEGTHESFIYIFFCFYLLLKKFFNIIKENTLVLMVKLIWHFVKHLSYRHKLNERVSFCFSFFVLRF